VAIVSERRRKRPATRARPRPSRFQSRIDRRPTGTGLSARERPRPQLAATNLSNGLINGYMQIGLQFSPGLVKQ